MERGLPDSLLQHRKRSVGVDPKAAKVPSRGPKYLAVLQP
jgi:hypothetical protein